MNILIEVRNYKSKTIQNFPRTLAMYMQISVCLSILIQILAYQLSHDMRFPRMWYEQTAKTQTILRIRTV